MWKLFYFSMRASPMVKNGLSHCKQMAKGNNGAQMVSFLLPFLASAIYLVIFSPKYGTKNGCHCLQIQPLIPNGIASLIEVCWKIILQRKFFEIKNNITNRIPLPYFGGEKNVTIHCQKNM